MSFNAQTSSTETNKAGYTATPVACGWAGAIFEAACNSGIETEGRTDRLTQQGSESRVRFAYECLPKEK